MTARTSSPSYPVRNRPPGPAMDPVGYDGLIIDLDGVVWRGGEPITGAAEAIAAVRGSGTRVLFVDNEPGRSRNALAERLAEIGIPATAADVMPSAAVAARIAGSLTGLANRRALVVGPPALHDEIKGAGFQLVTSQEAREAEVVVVGGHESFDYGELRAAAAALQGRAQLIATPPYARPSPPPRACRAARSIWTTTPPHRSTRA